MGQLLRLHTCGDLNTVCQEVLWVSWCPAVELTEVLAVLHLLARQETIESAQTVQRLGITRFLARAASAHRDVEAGEVEHGVLQHASVSSREGKAVTVEPG